MIRAWRLTGRRRFDAVRTAGTGAKGQVVNMRAVRNHEGASRAGLAMRGSRSAVERNRARRRVREALQPVLALHPGLDVIVSGSAPAVASVDFAVLRADVETTLAAVSRLTP